MIDSGQIVVPSPAQHSQSEYKAQNAVTNMNCVPLPNYLPLLDEKIKVQGFQDVLKDCHMRLGVTKSYVAKKLGVHFVTYFNYLCGKNRCSFEVLKKLSYIYGEDLLEIAFDNNFSFVSKGKIVRLPRELTSDLAYYVGYLQGDGYLESDKKSYGFCDEYLAQMQKITGLTESLFGISDPIREVTSDISKKPYYTHSVNSVVINSFIHKVFGVNLGEKQDLRIPKVILETKDLLRSYISGLFDSDGTLPKQPRQAKQLFIDIALKDKEFILEIQAALAGFGVRTLAPHRKESVSPSSVARTVVWELQIRRQEHLLRFLTEVGFKHPDKERREKEVISMLT